jgi:glutathione S-transferase
LTKRSAQKHQTVNIAVNRLQWLNGQMPDKDYFCGKRFTLADILL